MVYISDKGCLSLLHLQFAQDVLSSLDCSEVKQLADVAEFVLEGERVYLLHSQGQTSSYSLQTLQVTASPRAPAGTTAAGRVYTALGRAGGHLVLGWVETNWAETSLCGIQSVPLPGSAQETPLGVPTRVEGKGLRLSPRADTPFDPNPLHRLQGLTRPGQPPLLLAVHYAFGVHLLYLSAPGWVLAGSRQLNPRFSGCICAVLDTPSGVYLSGWKQFLKRIII